MADRLTGPFTRNKHTPREELVPCLLPDSRLGAQAGRVNPSTHLSFHPSSNPASQFSSVSQSVSPSAARRASVPPQVPGCAPLQAGILIALRRFRAWMQSEACP